MKKILLPLLAAVPAMVALADSETKILVGDPLNGLSPDGRYASSSDNGSVRIFDLDNDEHFDYAETNTNHYGTGNGNFWGNGAMVGYVDGVGGSAIWNSGRWSKLPLAAPDAAGMGNANGVTPDKSRICGNASTGVGLSLDEAKLMVYPCYWDVKPNGTYSAQQPLPYPTTDFLGQVPQYVTALCITEDGKTIFGQVVAGNGFFKEMIIYTQAEDGTWSYELPLRELLNPDHIEILPYPGDGPEVPSQENYMTDEELTEFDAAMQAYWADPQHVKMPTYEEFMTQEEIDAFNEEAVKPYMEWRAKYDKYEEVIVKLLEKSTSFLFNNMFISRDGRFVATTVERTYVLADNTLFSLYTPFLYDRQTGEAKTCGIDGFSMTVTGVSPEGNILASMDAGDVDLGYVLNRETSEWNKLGDYLVKRDPTLAEWVESNWVHEVEVVTDEATGATEFQMLEVTGRPFVSADWSTFCSTAYNFWGGESKGAYLGYVIRLNDGENAIERVEDTNSSAVEYFDLQGRRVAAPSNGIFIKRQGKETTKIRL